MKKSVKIILIGLAFFCLNVMAPSQSDAEIQKELDSQYKKLAEAHDKKDLKAIASLKTSDFHAILPDGRVADVKIMEMNTRQFIEMNQPPFNIKFTIRKLTVSYNKLIAVAEVFQEATRFRDYDGIRRKVETSVIQTEAWAKTSEGWKLKSVDNVRDQKRFVDGKRVDPSKPYNPDDPPYNPDDTTEKTTPDLTLAYDAAINRTFEKIADIPGIAIVVIKDDKPVFIKAYGMADKEAGRKADTNTLWYMGSSTKSFTALVAAMLDKEGKIKLSDPVTRYTAGIRFKTPLPDKITVRDLLTHTSGLTNRALIHRTAYTGQIEKNDIARVFAEGTAFDEANFGKYRYTNLGYNIYGILMENNLKLKWQDELQKRIFDPAGMSHTTAYRSRALAKKWAIAAPYVWDEQAGSIVRSVVDKVDNNMQAAGGHFMSINDLGKWLNLNMNGGKLNGKQVIPTELMAAVHTGYTKNTSNEPPFSGDGEYGLGWQIGKYRIENVIYHHGGYPGYRSHVSYMPDKRLAVGVLVNNDLAGGRMADMLAAYAYDLWLDTPNLEADYAKQLQDFSDLYVRRKQETTTAAAERTKRTSQLTEPLTAYVGRYTHDLLGTLDIRIEGNTLAVRMGNLYSVSTPFTQPDSIRVVMIPGGDGEIVEFVKGTSGKFDALQYAGREFKRVGS